MLVCRIYILETWSIGEKCVFKQEDLVFKIPKNSCLRFLNPESHKKTSSVVPILLDACRLCQMADVDIIAYIAYVSLYIYIYICPPPKKKSATKSTSQKRENKTVEAHSSNSAIPGP